MSHTARDDLDLASKFLNNNKDENKHNKPVNLTAFIADLNRTEPLVGLQYVVEMNVLGTDESLIRCDLCHVKGNLKAMIQHLTGFYHIKTYMEVYYFTELKSIKYSENKSKIPVLIKEFAKEIERAEPFRELQTEYISREDMESVFDTWLNENDNLAVFDYQQTKCQVLDRRKSALKFSDHFRISSRAEASAVLKLTQQLSDRVEQYFRNCKGLGLEVLETGVSDNRPKAYERITLPPDDRERAPLGLETKFVKPDLEHTLPAYAPTSVLSSDSLNGKIITSGELHTSNDVAFNNGSFPEISGLQSGQSQIFEDPSKAAFISSQPIACKEEDLSQPMTVEEYPSQPISATPSDPLYSSATESICAVTPAQVFEPHVSPTLLMSKEHVEATYEPKPPDVNKPIKIEANSDLSMVTSDSDVEASFEQEDSSQEASSSGQAQGKTSKSLSPDIIQLLKGKDANTVANILKTLSPFYPALQDVNLDILAQVLVNTGALA